MVDAAFLDSVVANYEISTSGKDYKVLPDGLDPEEYAIGFRLGDQALCEQDRGDPSRNEAGTASSLRYQQLGSEATSRP